MSQPFTLPQPFEPFVISGIADHVRDVVQGRAPYRKITITSGVHSCSFMVLLLEFTDGSILISVTLSDSESKIESRFAVAEAKCAVAFITAQAAATLLRTAIFHAETRTP